MKKLLALLLTVVVVLSMFACTEPDKSDITPTGDGDEPPVDDGLVTIYLPVSRTEYKADGSKGHKQELYTYTDKGLLLTHTVDTGALQEAWNEEDGIYDYVAMPFDGNPDMKVEITYDDMGDMLRCIQTTQEYSMGAGFVTRVKDSAKDYAYSYFHLPDGRVVRVDWDRWGLPADRFNGQMGIPMELTLDQHRDKYYLQAKPVTELDCICKETAVFVTPQIPFRTELEKSPYLLKLTGKGLGLLTLTVFGRTIRFDFEKNQLWMAGCTAPISVAEDNLDVTVIVDRCSLELYADNGRIYVSAVNNETISDYNIPYLTVTADEDTVLDRIEVTALESIWA